MVEQPLHRQGCSLDCSASSCPFQECAGPALRTKTSSLECAFQQPCSSALMNCLTALVKQTLQHFCKGFWVRYRSPLAPAEDLQAVVARVRGDGDRLRAFFHVVESLEPVLGAQVYMLMGSEVTCEGGQAADVLAHLDWSKHLFSCSSVHPRTFGCKGRPRCSPSPQMQECVIATLASLKVLGYLLSLKF